MSTPIEIILADDHSVVREGLRALLQQQPDMHIVAEARDGLEAVQLAHQHAPNVVVLDMKMPGPGVLTTIADIRKASPNTHILIFTSFAEDSQVRDALAAGATGYLLKDALTEDLSRAIREVALGQAWLHPHAQRQMLEWVRRPPSPLASLTARELSVLDLIAAGNNNKRISRELNLSEGTVKGYVSHILEKLGVADRTQAALLVLKERGGNGRESN